MVNGTCFSKEARTLAESTTSTSSAKSSVSTGAFDNMNNMRSGRINGINKFCSRVKRGEVANDFSPPLSQFPRLPAAVPLLTEKQQQLLLRYLCVSNDEASRTLIQAAARQHIYPGEEKAAVAIGDRTTSASISKREAATVPTAFSSDGELSSGPPRLEKRTFSSGWRSAARASSSSPVSPFASVTRKTSDDSHGVAAALRYAVSTTPRLPEKKVSRYAAHDGKERPCQQQSIAGLHSPVLCVEALQRPQLKHKEIEQPQRQQKLKSQQQLEHCHLQQPQVDLRDTNDAGSALQEAGSAIDPAATQVVCPLRPCLRRRSNVRFRSPVAEDSEEQSYRDNSATARTSTRVHAALAETCNSTTLVASDTIVSSTCALGKSISSSSSACHPNPCSSNTCHVGFVPSCFPARPSLLRVSSNHSSNILHGAGHSKPLNNLDSQKFVHCCFRCPGFATCNERASPAPRVQCSCCSQLLRHDSQAITPAPAGETADPRGAAVPVIVPQPSIPSATSRPCAPRRCQCAAETSDEDRSYRYRAACCFPGDKEEFCSCYRACCTPSFYLEDTSSTSSHDEQEEKLLSFTSSSLRPRVLHSLVLANPPPTDKTRTCAPEESAATRAATAASEATESAPAQVGGKKEKAGALAQTEDPTACQLFCRYLYSHEEEGPRPCCGPGRTEKEMVTQLRRAHEKHNEITCCCSIQRFPSSDPLQKPIFPPRSTSCQANGRSRLTCNCGRSPGTIHKPISVSDAGFPSQALADGRNAGAPAHQEEAAGAPEVGNTHLPCSRTCKQRSCIQQHQRDRLPKCCSRHAGQMPEPATIQVQQCCLHADLQFPAAATTVAGENISCCATFNPLIYEEQRASAPSPCARDKMKGTTQQSEVDYRQSRAQQEDGLAQQRQMEQRQQPFIIRQPSGQRIELLHTFNDGQWRQTYLRPIATSTVRRDAFQTQHELCTHGKGAAADGVQRRCVYFKPAGTAVPAPSAAAGLLTTGEPHTPSTAPTLSSATSSTTPSCTSAIVRSEESGNASVDTVDKQTSSCLRNTFLKLPAGRTSATRALASTLSAGAAATLATAPVQTAAPHQKVGARRLRLLQPAALAASTPTGLPRDDYKKTMLPEGGLWKFEARVSHERPVAGKTQLVSDSNSPGPMEQSNLLQGVPAGSSAERPSTAGTCAAKAASRANTVDCAGGLAAWPGLRRGQEAFGTPATRYTNTVRVSELPVEATSTTSPTEGHSATSFIVIPGATPVVNSTGTPKANGVVLWCDTQLEDDQVGKDLEQLLRRQQEELAEQLRRLDALEKRQQELKQPQLRRRQDWWQRLQALEHQLQRQKIVLEEQQHQRSLGARQLMEQDSVKQQALQIEREQRQTRDSGLICSLARGPREQQQPQTNGQPQPATDSVSQIQLHQRRETRFSSADEGQRRDVGDALSVARVSSVEACSRSCASRICSHTTGKDPVTTNDTAAPASLVVLSRSTRKFQAQHSVQHQPHRLHQHQQHEGRHQQQETAHQHQQRHPSKTSRKRPSQPKAQSAARSGVAAHCENSLADSREIGQRGFTVESEQLLLDEDDEEQELLELQEISEALEAAQF